MAYRNDKNLPVIIVTVLAFAFVLFARNSTLFGSKILPTAPRLAPNGSYINDPCFVKKKCLVFYLAPWCPHCEGSISFLNGLFQRVQRKSDLGMLIVVGMDEKQNLIQMANRLDSTVVLDEDRKFDREANVRGVPAGWLIDQNRNILDKIPASMSGGTGEEDLYKYYFEHYVDVQ